MFFSKYPHPANFLFPRDYDAKTGELGEGMRVDLEGYKGDVFHVRIADPARWSENGCLESLEPPAPAKSSRLSIGKGFHLKLKGQDGHTLLESVAGQGFGVSGEASMFQFQLPEGTRFYGMGEKTFGEIELSGYRTKFWNTDVWGDFHHAQWGSHPTDPPYFSLPYLIARIGDEYVGFLLHNPYPNFMETPGTDESRIFVEWQRTSPHLVLGSEGGEPNLWILYGPTLPELTRKLQKLVGVTPVPPLWSLGYHQSRWGYGGDKDLRDLDAKFEKHQIPCDALWLDLDYMDGYRIFTVSHEMFPKGVAATAKALAKNGRRMVPILDPGVKRDPGYEVYDSGKKAGVFCQNPVGTEFVGLVWPGETVFPDFTTQAGRAWWTDYAVKFRDLGFAAVWCDMNDPSTGPVDPTSMLFRQGTEPHAAHHNQYGLGMQMATTDAFLRFAPDERPFVLSRSGFIGTSKHAAVWTGDNVSNYFYLAISIPTSVGMSISGQPFNGPDVGGFGGVCTDALMCDWVKCGFLFPLMRNHADRKSGRQEPWAFHPKTQSVVRRYIRLRYKLLPYLYNLFIDQEAQGDPILRPLFYEFSEPELDEIDDQFMVGPSILQAPFVAEGAKSREVTLPGQGTWYDAAAGTWVPAGKRTVKAGIDSTPLFVRAGAVIPMQPGTPTNNQKNLAKVNLHLFTPDDWTGETTYLYQADDGESFAYRVGERSQLTLRAVGVEGNLAIATESLISAFGPIEATLVIHGSPKSVRVNGSVVALNPDKVTLTGRSLPVHVVAGKLG